MIIRLSSLVLLFGLILAGCTSVAVRPISLGQAIKEVYIKENPRSEVPDMLDVIVEGFERNGVAAKIATKDVDPAGKYIVSYMAYDTWDLKAYLSHATIWIELDGRRVAFAEYKHSGGFGLNKWASTKEKINPVIDRLLHGESAK